MFRNLLIPTDGSRLSARGVKAGVRLAKALGARVTGLYVMFPYVPPVYGEASLYYLPGLSPAESKQDTTGLEHGRPVISVVTLASLVERETPKPEERPLVAGAFANRLQKRIPLQCDPTVIYALQDAGRYNGKLTGTDLHFDSPYNTYAHPGLPPGPIGNPGEASLRAALDPAKTDYLYFVFSFSPAEEAAGIQKCHRDARNHRFRRSSTGC